MTKNKPTNALTAEICGSINKVNELDWDRCLDSDHPFMRHAFFYALEQSGSANAETGWLPRHILIRQNNVLVGAMPMYLKNHSAGEYVFDHGWADAFSQAGGNYYPKLQVSVPFSPVTGPRILVSPIACSPQEVRDKIINTALDQCKTLNASSIHITFPSEQDWNFLGKTGLMQRTGIQFHWKNSNYKSFEDFLSSLSSRKRKKINRERRNFFEGDITISELKGLEIKEHHWDHFYFFYNNTTNRKWGIPYLTREFFSLLSQLMPEQIVIFIAERNGKPIAGALNLIGNSVMYGRNWGCIESHPFLHFELCYYRAIEFSIRNQLFRVEAGAQGLHKLSRGYLPTPTYSAHWILNKELRDAVNNYLNKETTMINNEIKSIAKYSPYRN
tara:strand:- start:135585 stop:136745 length:1161 start_codon:yes stop_codon:yes gene_type:complete